MYISPIDILDITLDELIAIDEKKIIRLEKRLKILKLQGQENFFNQEATDNLLLQLRDKEKKEAIIFIEKHLNFKAFISNGEDHGPKMFFFEEFDVTTISPITTAFLAPYLETYFIPLLKNNYKNNKYDTIIAALKARKLFSEALLLKCYQYIIQQANILSETILNTGPSQLFEKKPQVTYGTYIQLLNLVPVGIINSCKIDYVNALVHYFNKNKNNNREYPKLKNAYRLIPKIKVSNPHTQKQLQELGSLGFFESTYDHNQTKESSGSGADMIKIVAFIIIAVITVARFANSRSSSNYNSNNSNFTYDIERLINEQRKKEIHLQNYFIKKLYDNANSVDNKISVNLLNLKTGAKPYKKFNYGQYFKANKTHALLIKDSILIENNSQKDLILFKKNPFESFKTALYITKKSALNIPYKKNCELIFYLGNDFGEVYYQDKSEPIFTTVAEKDKEYLLQKFTLLEEDNIAAKKITIENDTINFYTLKKTVLKNKSITKIKNTKIKKEVNYEEAYNSPKHKNWGKEKNSFFKKLNSKVAATSIKKTPHKMANGQNPYPNYFSDYKHSDISGYPVLIKNNTYKHVIVFNRNLKDNRDFAAYIKPKKELTVYLYEEGDSLYFNKGDYFYEHKSLLKLKMDTHDQGLFAKPIVTKGFLVGEQVIDVNDHNIKPYGIAY